MIEPVDSLRIDVLIDNVTDGLSSAPTWAPSEFLGALRRGSRPASGRTLCCAAHGLSLLLTAQRDGQTHTVLFDTGPEDYALERNVGRLQAELAAVEAIVLSHGHWDHCGGVLTALAACARPSRRIQVYTHPDMFHTRALRLPNGIVSVMDDIPSQSDIVNAGAELVITDEAQYLLDAMFYLSGEIPRVTGFEPGMLGQLRRASDDSDWQTDEVMADERWLGVQVAGKGLVVLTACSHAGVINVLRDATRAFGELPLYGVLGGLHLSGPSEQFISTTVDALAEFDLRLIGPAHCTGWRAVTALANRFGDQVVVPSAVGRSYQF